MALARDLFVTAVQPSRLMFTGGAARAAFVTQVATAQRERRAGASLTRIGAHWTEQIASGRHVR
jgi:hypothetical protein